jgi:hypothetical protein
MPDTDTCPVCNEYFLKKESHTGDTGQLNNKRTGSRRTCYQKTEDGITIYRHPLTYYTAERRELPDSEWEIIAYGSKLEQVDCMVNPNFPPKGIEERIEKHKIEP